MECKEMLLEELAKRIKAIETQVTRLNVHADQACHDSYVQQGFTQIKADLRAVEVIVEEALAKSAAVAG